MKELLRKFENSYLKYATGLLLLVIPLYPKFPLLPIADSNVAIRLEDFVIAGVVLGWVAIVLRRRERFWSDPVVWVVGWFWATVFLAAVSAILVTRTVDSHVALLHAARRVEYMVVMFLAVSTVTNREVLRFFMKLVLVATFVATLYGFGQRVLALPVISTMNAEFAQGLALSLGADARVNATFAGHYDLAAYLVPVLILTLVMVFVAQKKREKSLVVILFFLFVWLMLASASRVSFAAYLVVAVGVLVIVKKWAWIVPVVAISLVMAAFSQSLTMRYATLVNVTVTDAYQKLVALRLVGQGAAGSNRGGAVTISPTPKAAGTSGGLTGEIATNATGLALRKRHPRPTPTQIAPPVIEDRSMSIRLNVEWPRAINALVKNPLLGTGPSSITLATDNDYLRVLGETGLVGMLSLLAVFVTVFWVTKPLLRKPISTIEGAIGWGMLGGTIGLMINGAFIDVLEASKVALVYWLLVGIWVGTARLAEVKEKK